MPDPFPPDFFAAAGIPLDAPTADTPKKPKRKQKPRQPSPAERAAVVRLDAARRQRGRDQKGRGTHSGVSRKTADVYAFPPSRNQKLVAALLARFQMLLQKHDREDAKSLFEETCLAPLRARLMQIGQSSVMIDNELYALKAAVRDLGLLNHAKRSVRIGS